MTTHCIYFSGLCDPKLHLGRHPRLSLRLLPLTGTLRICFVLYTFTKGADNLPICTDKMCPNPLYCAACHCSTARDVALDACNSKLFFLGTYFSSLCDPKWQLGRHPRLSRRLHPHFSLNNCRGFAATYRTVCYGWRVGIVKSIVIVIATAGPDCDLKLLQTTTVLLSLIHI